MLQYKVINLQEEDARNQVIWKLRCERKIKEGPTIFFKLKHQLFLGDEYLRNLICLA